LSTVPSAGAALAGYDAVCAMAGRVVLLLPLMPLLHLGRIKGLGKWIYARLASGSPRPMASECDRPAFVGVATGRVANTILIAFSIFSFAYAVRLPLVGVWNSGELAGMS